MIDNSDHFLLPLLQFDQWVDEGAKESVRPMTLISHANGNSSKAVEVAEGAVAVVDSAPLPAQTTMIFPKRIHCLNNTTTISTYWKRRREMCSGMPYGVSFPIAFALQAPKGSRPFALEMQMTKVVVV